MAQQPNSDLGRLVAEISRSHTIRTRTQTHTSSRTPLNEWSARHRGRYIHNTQQTRETNIQSHRGIRTRDTTNRAASDLRLRPHGHRDWKGLNLPFGISMFPSWRRFVMVKFSNRMRLCTFNTNSHQAGSSSALDWYLKGAGFESRP